MHEPTFDLERAKRISPLFMGLAGASSLASIEVVVFSTTKVLFGFALGFFVAAIPLLLGRYVLLAKEIDSKAKIDSWFRMPMHYGGVIFGYTGFVLFFFAYACWLGAIFLVISLCVIMLIEITDAKNNRANEH
jgi:hypothetical protein